MKDIIEISRYRDGGTSVWIEPSVKASLKTIEEAENCQKYYLDNRINSTTKGELYDRYPSKEGALVLNKNNFNFIKTETPTLGEQRVRTTFNPSNESVVDRIKQKSAELIDLLQAVRNDEVSKTYDKTPEQLQAQSGEKLRLISLAQTGYEEAAMWAVKAATC